MKKLIILFLGLFATNSASAITLGEFGTICRDGDPGVASAWISTDAATIFASLLFNPNSTVEIGNCRRTSTITQGEARSEGSICEFVHSGDLFKLKIQFPQLIKASIVSIAGVQILSYSSGSAPLFTSVNSKGEPLNIPGGPLMASCDIGSNDSYLLFENGTVWELNQPRHL